MAYSYETISNKTLNVFIRDDKDTEVDLDSDDNNGMYILNTIVTVFLIANGFFVCVLAFFLYRLRHKKVG